MFQVAIEIDMAAWAAGTPPLRDIAGALRFSGKEPIPSPRQGQKGKRPAPGEAGRLAHERYADVSRRRQIVLGETGGATEDRTIRSDGEMGGSGAHSRVWPRSRNRYRRGG